MFHVTLSLHTFRKACTPREQKFRGASKHIKKIKYVPEAEGAYCIVCQGTKQAVHALAQNIDSTVGLSLPTVVLSSADVMSFGLL